ncbi:hypothetical protein Celaphus_00013218, partial [Cervus elaphus hippelaphus]
LSEQVQGLHKGLSLQTQEESRSSAAAFGPASGQPRAAALLTRLSRAETLDRREDADGAGRVLRRGPQPSHQVAEAPGVHGRAGRQQRLAGQGGQ